MVAYGGTESNYVDNITGISTIKENNSESTFIDMNKRMFSYFQDATITLGNVGSTLAYTVTCLLESSSYDCGSKYLIHLFNLE